MVVLIEFIPCRPFSGNLISEWIWTGATANLPLYFRGKAFLKRETGLPTDQPKPFGPRIKPADQVVEGPEGSIG
jgi:hypothetical protein